jgi:hypothetical protein
LRNSNPLLKKVWHFRLGKCSIVTARLYALIMIALFSAGAGWYVYARPSLGFHQNPLMHHNTESHPIDETWIDYLQDCGGEQVIENFVHTKLVYNEKYENYQVNWSGYIAETKGKSDPLFSWIPNANYLQLMIKMSPSESAIFADLVLSVSSSLFQENKALFNSLQKGEGINFKATLVGLGNEFKMHHLQAIEVTKNGDFKNLEDIVVRESSLP